MTRSARRAATTTDEKKTLKQTKLYFIQAKHRKTRDWFTYGFSQTPEKAMKDCDLYRADFTTWRLMEVDATILVQDKIKPRKRK